MELLFAGLAAAAHGRPPGGRALARVQLPRAVARHGPILLGGQPPVVPTATETDGEREKRGGGALSACVQKTRRYAEDKLKSLKLRFWITICIFIDFVVVHKLQRGRLLDNNSQWVTSSKASKSNKKSTFRGRTCM